jgi:stage V sporulation protein G
MTNNENNVKLEVRAYPISEPKGNVVAFASATINDMFAVNNIRVVNSEKGFFVAMPQIKDAKGEYRDICFPVTPELRKLLNDTVLGAYAVAEKEKAAPAKESTVDKLREAKEDKTPPAKSKSKSAPKKSEPEL